MRTFNFCNCFKLFPCIILLLLLSAAQKSSGQCSIDLLTYQTDYISNDSISICYTFKSENNISDTYNVLFNDNLVKTANYINLETDNCFTITKNEFTISNQLLVHDSEDLNCSEAVNLNIVYDTFENGPGCFKNFSVEKSPCEGGGFFIDLNFTSSYYPQSGSFTLFSNNEEVGIYKYEDLPVTLGPYFKTQQIDLSFRDTEYFCGGNVQVYAVACEISDIPHNPYDPGYGPPFCTLKNLKTTQVECANEQNKVSVALDFDHSFNDDEQFHLIYHYDDLSLDSILYNYKDLPIEIGDLNGDGFTSYGLTVVDASSSVCKSEIFLSELSCVVPGNTNGDRNNCVNHIDLLKIGEAYGENGPPRINATVNATSQLAESWNSFFNNGWNFKHADCNGNGTIDKKDALIIKQNYSRKSFKNEDQKYLSFKTGGIPIGVEVPRGTVTAYSEITLPIIFGQSDNLVGGLYGMAFSLNIDTNYINPKSIRLDLTDSWLNKDTDEVISIFEFNKFDSQLNVSLTKTNGKSTAGYGNIANLRIVVMVEIELEKRAKDFEVVIDDVVISDKSSSFESIVNRGLHKIESKAMVITEVPDYTAAINFKIYPTPTNGTLNINSNSGLLTNIKVFNLIGSPVFTSDFKNNTTIKTDTWASGIYLLHLDNGEAYQQKKIIVE